MPWCVLTFNIYFFIFGHVDLFNEFVVILIRTSLIFVLKLNNVSVRIINFIFLRVKISLATCFFIYSEWPDFFISYLVFSSSFYLWPDFFFIYDLGFYSEWSDYFYFWIKLLDFLHMSGLMRLSFNEFRLAARHFIFWNSAKYTQYIFSSLIFSMQKKVFWLRNIKRKSAISRKWNIKLIKLLHTYMDIFFNYFPVKATEFLAFYS